MLQSYKLNLKNTLLCYIATNVDYTFLLFPSLPLLFYVSNKLRVQRKAGAPLWDDVALAARLENGDFPLQQPPLFLLLWTNIIQYVLYKFSIFDEI